MTFIPGILILLMALALPLGAQNFAEITGAVSDPTGAVMAGAAVTAMSASTNQVRRATTNETGNYSLPYLVPGTYDVRVESAGFKIATRKGVRSEEHTSELQSQ